MVMMPPKAGVIMLTRSLAAEFACHNIRVNAIAPGYVRTEINEYLLNDPEALRAIEASISLVGFLLCPKTLWCWMGESLTVDKWACIIRLCRILYGNKNLGGCYAELNSTTTLC